MKAALLELRRHDWAGLRCGCQSSAAHLAETFERLLSARTPEETVGYELEGHVEQQSMLFQVAPHAVPVILAALAENGLPQFVRARFLTSLCRMVTGESHRSEAAAGLPDLEEDCCEAAREGLWVLYREAASGDAEAALDILEWVDLDEHRFEFFCSALADRLEKTGREARRGSPKSAKR